METATAFIDVVGGGELLVQRSMVGGVGRRDVEVEVVRRSMEVATVGDDPARATVLRSGERVIERVWRRRRSWSSAVGRLRWRFLRRRQRARTRVAMAAVEV